MSSGHGKPPRGYREINAFTEWIEKFGGNATYLLLFFSILALFAIFSFIDVTPSRVVSFIVLLSPIWLPAILFFMFYGNWMYYVRTHFKIEQGRVSLEIKLPQEIFKSPQAMEMVLTQLYQTASPDNHIQTYWDGKHPPTYGFEIISTEGRIRFIINVPRKKFKNMAETYLYSQYPGIEITELPIDYTAAIPWNPDKFQVFSLHFGKNLKKGDIFPIKTYIDYKLDEDPKEEFKHEPLSPMLEFLGSIGPGEHVWMQFLATAHREESFQTGSLGTVPDWKGAIDKQIATVMGREIEGHELEDSFTALKLTDNERDTVKALERIRKKYAFKVYIRAVYAAEKDRYLPGERIGPIITNIFPFNDLTRNDLKLRWRTDYNWNWWQDPTGKKKEHLKKEELENYKLRVYEPRTHNDTGSIFSVEELATMYHFPGAVVTTPNLVRIPSARGEAPLNLPTG